MEDCVRCDKYRDLVLCESFVEAGKLGVIGPWDCYDKTISRKLVERFIVFYAWEDSLVLQRAIRFDRQLVLRCGRQDIELDGMIILQEGVLTALEWCGLFG